VGRRAGSASLQSAFVTAIVGRRVLGIELGIELERRRSDVGRLE
jgi:hypothetical protein